ncbi:MAG: hypothetical protein D3923_08355 [Candidatus Electrothrix sp. AR3]|nr:hypothetical protein [Candidatus Electrothrix sp. AR3]
MISLSYSITSCTPLVTGDHQHRNTALLSSGILGSLRYQYWLLKAMQAWQANPQQPNYPLYSIQTLEHKTKQDLLAALDQAGPVVQLFGATNWKKMFRLEISDAQRGMQQPCSARSDDTKTEKKPYHWTCTLSFRQDRKVSFFKGIEGQILQNELEQLMSFVYHYGWLGAAPQNGLGWVQVQGLEQEQMDCIVPPPANPVFAAQDIVFTKGEKDKLLAVLRQYYQEKHNQPGPGWKRNRYLNSIEHLGKNPPPVGYEIRRWLRDQQSPEFLFGGRNHAGFVHVSHPLVQADQGWRIRLRFATRPSNAGGINPAQVTPSPAGWLEQSTHILRSL